MQDARIIAKEGGLEDDFDFDTVPQVRAFAVLHSCPHLCLERCLTQTCMCRQVFGVLRIDPEKAWLQHSRVYPFLFVCRSDCIGCFGAKTILISASTYRYCASLPSYALYTLYYKLNGPATIYTWYTQRVRSVWFKMDQ